MSEAKRMIYGYGLLLKEEQGLSLMLMSEKETIPELPPCGTHFLKTDACSFMQLLKS